MLNNTGACCLALASAFGNKTAFPSSTPYASSLGSYFSHQEASVSPLCIVFPTTTDDVSLAIKTLTSISSRHDASPDTKAACQFAIRSGGHASIAGAANIQGGVTLDLTNLDTIKLSPDQSIVSVGPGNSWDAVYSVLDGLNLSVAGGRTAGVGVGGLSVGGGISYLSTRYGWTSDTIINYELVLANGSIVSANAEQNPDLLWALRGGGNNFGVVTRVDLQTFEQEPFWGGYLYHTASFWEEEAAQFDSINSAEAYDEYAHLTLTWGYSAAAGSIISNQVQYTKSPAVADPAIFQPLTGSSPIFSSLGISNTSGFSTALAGQQVYGERQFWTTATLVSTEKAVKITYEHFNASLGAIEDVENIVYALTLEPLPPAFYARHASLNPLGFQNRTDSLIVVLLTVSYTNEADDSRVERAGREMIAGIENDARKLDLLDPFLYLNYAGSYQDPIATYGEENVRRLRAIAHAVDPEGVFRTQVPGGFKIPQ